MHTLIERSGLKKRIDALGHKGRSGPRISNGEMSSLAAVLYSTGTTVYDRFDRLGGSVASGLAGRLAKELYGIKDLPSADQFRQQMNNIANLPGLSSAVRASIREMLLKSGVLLQPLPYGRGYIPIDGDVTVFNNSKTKKEGIGYTYQKNFGYAPFMIYIGYNQGFCLGVEFRPGNQNGQKGAPEFLRAMIHEARELTDQALLIRLDSGHDAAVNYVLFQEEGVDFIVKGNPRMKRTNLVAFAEKHIPECKDVRMPRPGKSVYLGSYYKTMHSNGHPIRVRMVYEITVRDSVWVKSKGTADGYYQYMIQPEYEVDLYYTSFTKEEMSDRNVINLYHDHGTCEQYHSELKTDMDVERLPSKYFATNKLVCELAMLAYNALRIIGSFSMECSDVPVSNDVDRHRLKTIIDGIIHLEAKVTSHARRVHLVFSENDSRTPVYHHVEQRVFGMPA